MKSVVGYEGRYSVTEYGEVWAHPNVSRSNGRWLKQCKMRCGYLYVCLFKDGKRNNRYVHKLVSAAYIGPSNDLQVNHIDGNKENNKLENLELVTASRNRKHAFEIGLQVVSDKQREASRMNITNYNRSKNV